MAEIAATVLKTVTFQGAQYKLDESTSGDAVAAFQVSLAAAKTGTLTTRTDDNTGTLTMSGGHGIADGDRLDVYWATGSRRGMTVGTVATNSVPVDGGSGDNLPTQGTAVTAMVATSEAVAAVGNNVVAAGVRVDGRVTVPTVATVVFAQSDNTEVKAYTVTASATNDSAGWATTSGATNPFAGVTVGKVFVSHGDATGAVVIRGYLLYT